MSKDVQVRSLSVIAREIESDWGAKVYFGARPYLNAMKQLNSVEDNFYDDTAVSVVAYFLSNAKTWRGDVARRVKKELNKMLKK
ncbi:MAG: hypothetical protein ACXABD_13285 [Candidatus Thorarchaeota archaeon]|jgi:hypothetical protein